MTHSHPTSLKIEHILFLKERMGPHQKHFAVDLRGAEGRAGKLLADDLVHSSRIDVCVHGWLWGAARKDFPQCHSVAPDITLQSLSKTGCCDDGNMALPYDMNNPGNLIEASMWCTYCCECIRFKHQHFIKQE